MAYAKSIVSQIATWLVARIDPHTSCRPPIDQSRITVLDRSSIGQLSLKKKRKRLGVVVHVRHFNANNVDDRYIYE